MSQTDPNPYHPPRPSWFVPILSGVLATILLHSPVLWVDMAWLALCCTLGCSGAPVGAVPALLALRADPHLGPASGFSVAFIAVGIGSILLAIVAVVGWELDPVVLDNVRTELKADGYTQEEVDEAVEGLKDVSRYFPIVAAGLMALMGGLAGALAAAIVGRRHPPPPPQWGPPATPGSPPPPA